MYANEPAIVLEYTDPAEAFKGWLVVDGMRHSLCAGGLRVQENLTADALKKMARNMTRKMRVWGMPIDGAKCGIAYDPRLPTKDEAVRRFMVAIKPFLLTYYSMGADLNTRMDRLEQLASSIGVPSIKMAIASAQGISLQEYYQRYVVLGETVIGNWNVGQLRAGWGVGMAALALLNNLGIAHNSAAVAIQGFGTLAKASLVGLREAGVRIVAVADAEKCLVDQSGGGLDVDMLLATDSTLLPLPRPGDSVAITPSKAVIETECDVLLLEAIENAITIDNVHLIRAKGVAPGANLAVSDAAEDVLHRRSISVLPCFVVGSGGSVAMNGLFGPEHKPTPRQVLDFVKTSMEQMVSRLLSVSRTQGITPTQAALRIIEAGQGADRARPYAV